MDPVWVSVMETCLERKLALMVALYLPVFFGVVLVHEGSFSNSLCCMFRCFNYLILLRVVFVIACSVLG